MTRNLPFTVRAEVDPWYSKYFIIRNFKRTPTCAHRLKNVDLKKKNHKHVYISRAHYYNVQAFSIS